MGLFRKKKLSEEKLSALDTKSFFDCICPATAKFYADHYLVGDSYRCAWAIRETQINLVDPDFHEQVPPFVSSCSKVIVWME